MDVGDEEVAGSGSMSKGYAELWNVSFKKEVKEPVAAPWATQGGATKRATEPDHPRWVVPAASKRPAASLGSTAWTRSGGESPLWGKKQARVVDIPFGGLPFAKSARDQGGL